MDKNTSSISGLSLGTTLFLIFLVLQLVGVIEWSWWWVTAPLWGSLALYLVVISITFFCLWIQHLNNKRKIKKWQKRRKEEINNNEQ